MQLPAYQIHNVLRQYIRRLNRRQRTAAGKGSERAREERGLLAVAQRREIVRRVMAAIKEKVGRVRPVPPAGNGRNPLPADSEVEAAAGNGRHAPFVYNLIDRNHLKITRTVSVDVPGLLAKDDSGRHNAREDEP